MAKKDPRPVDRGSLNDSFVGLADSASRFLLVAGGFALVIGVGILLYNFFVLAGNPAAPVAQANQNIALFGQVALYGAIAASLGVAWIMWGEETVGPILLIVGAAMVFAPQYLPMIVTVTNPAEPVRGSLYAVQAAGFPVVIIGLLVLAADVTSRVRVRVREGARADQLKFGKGVKEERDVRNVFLGKCWQLPYCRKFVRERCPIYHARRTCWKERVGCMCEESVIRNAMEGRVIPTDIVAASKFIPRTSKLTPDQKAERCRQCVIYNEHQKHKYKLLLPASITGLGLVYLFFREPLANGIQAVLDSADRVLGQAMFRPEAAQAAERAPAFSYNEVILVALMFIVLAYMVRLIEYLVFKIKV